MNYLKYSLRIAASLPWLPALVRQGKQIRRTVPRLPAASGPVGSSGKGSESLTLITLGESTMAGIGVDTHQNGFTGSLAEALSKQYDARVSWKVYAKSGFTASMLSRRMLPHVQEKTADIIVIGLGGNDAFHLTPPWTWRRNILQLIKALRQQFSDTPIVFINMPPIREFPAFTPLIRKIIGSHAEMLGDVLETMADPQKKVWFISEQIELARWRRRLDLPGDPSDFFSDGVHPSPLTYKIWGLETARFIAENNVI